MCIDKNMLYGAEIMKKISIQMLSIIAGVSAFLSLALRIVCMFFFYDDIGYYKSGAVLPIIANIIFGVSIAFFLFASIFCIDKKQRVMPTSKASQYAALLPMGALIFHVIRIFTTVFNDTNVNKYLLAISALVSAAFFLFIFLAKKKYATAIVYLGIGVFAYLFLAWMFVYFDFFIPINSTDKTFFYLACAGAIIFVFNEMAASYGAVRSRFYYFSLFASIIALSTATVSAIVGYAFGIFKAYITLEFDLFFLALLVYAVTRLIDAQKSTVIIEGVSDKAVMNTENDENAESIENTDENQETVDDDSE